MLPACHLAKLPIELLLEIQTHLCPVQSTCLGLTCKRLYGIHWGIHGKVLLSQRERRYRLARPIWHENPKLKRIAWVVKERLRKQIDSSLGYRLKVWPDPENSCKLVPRAPDAALPHYQELSWRFCQDTTCWSNTQFGLGGYGHSREGMHVDYRTWKHFLSTGNIITSTEILELERLEREVRDCG